MAFINPKTVGEFGMSTTTLVIIAVCMLAISGCKVNERNSVDHIQCMIEQNLKVGDPESKIVAVFMQNNFPYNFNQLEHRYESGVPNSLESDSQGLKSVIMINIYVNEDISFKKVEVREVHTYL